MTHEVYIQLCGYSVVGLHGGELFYVVVTSVIAGLTAQDFNYIIF